MRDKPEKQMDPSTGYTTREMMLWQSDYAREQLTDFMNRMGKDEFVKHGIEICNRYGNKHFKTEEDLLKFLEHSPKYMKCCFDIHGKEAEREISSRPKLFITPVD